VDAFGRLSFRVRHRLGFTTGAGLALLEEFSDLRIRSPARAPASSAGAAAIKAAERPQRRPARGRALGGRHGPRPPASACARHPSRFRRTENRGRAQFRYCPPSRGSI
jgi:hypothetical protein